MNNSNKIGEKLRSLRSQHGLSQSELGARIGVSFQQIQKYEAGRNQISITRLCQLADVFQMSAEQLLSYVLNLSNRPQHVSETQWLQAMHQIEPASTQWLMLELAQTLAKKR